MLDVEDGGTVGGFHVTQASLGDGRILAMVAEGHVVGRKGDEFFDGTHDLGNFSCDTGLFMLPDGDDE